MSTPTIPLDFHTYNWNLALKIVGKVCNTRMSESSLRRKIQKPYLDPSLRESWGRQKVLGIDHGECPLRVFEWKGMTG